MKKKTAGAPKQKRLGSKVGSMVVVMLAFCTLAVGAMYISRFYGLVLDCYEDECVNGTNILAYCLEREDPEDPERLLDDLKARTGCEFTIFEGDTRACTTILGEDGERAVGTRLTGAAYDAVFTDKTSYVGEASILGVNYLCSYVPTKDGAGNVTGLIFAGVPVSSSMRQVTLTIIAVMLISAALVGLSILWLLKFMRRNVSRPLEALTGIVRDMEEGNLSGEGRDAARAIRSNDEVGYLARATGETMERLRGYIGEIDSILSAIAAGDLTCAPKQEYCGDFASIRDSLELILSRLNDDMGQIAASSDSVSSGADMVSSGSQELSQGAGEQSAAVEDMKRAFDDVSGRIRSAAASASRTSGRTAQVGADVSESTRKMDELTEAMAEIRASSDAIGNIIKTIEDIAFQTNILALNASVEAARAGEHGRGFAVVADEVRSLAGKSAEASQSTASLIRRSAQAVENGSRVVDETAGHLKAVEGGVGEIVSAIDGIASDFEAQSAAVDRIQVQMEQISSVVQSNTANAEQSAAASEELSGQAELLRNLVGRFRLKR